jgi:hypothetical protein
MLELNVTIDTEIEVAVSSKVSGSYKLKFTLLSPDGFFVGFIGTGNKLKIPAINFDLPDVVSGRIELILDGYSPFKIWDGSVKIVKTNPKNFIKLKLEDSCFVILNNVGGIYEN